MGFYMYKVTNKGQVEVFGLAIIVIILFLVFVFAVRYSIGGQGQISEEVYFQKQTLAQNFVNTLYSTYVPSCSDDVDFKFLVKDCAEYFVYDETRLCNGGRTFCDNGRRLCNDGSTSCEKMREVIDSTLPVVDNLHRDYYFSIYGVDDDGLPTVESDHPLILYNTTSRTNCRSRGLTRVQGTAAPIPLDFTTIIMTLELCE